MSALHRLDTSGGIQGLRTPARDDPEAVMVEIAT